MQYFDRASKMMALQEKFILAVVNGDIEKINSLFDVEPTPQEPEPLVPDVNGEIQSTPMILFAAKRKDWKLLSELYFREANIDVCDTTHGWHLVNEVTINAPDKVFETLLSEFDMDVVTRDGDSPLMIALKNDKFERAEYMLRNTAVQYSTINIKKENAGHFALRKGQYDLFIELVKMGMSYDLKNKEGKTPIDLVEDPILQNELKDRVEKLKSEVNVRQAANGKNKVVIEEVVEEKEVEEPVKKVLSGLSKIKRA